MEHLQNFFVGLHASKGVYTPAKDLAAYVNSCNDVNDYKKSFDDLKEDKTSLKEIPVPNFEPPTYAQVYDTKNIRPDGARG